MRQVNELDQVRSERAGADHIDHVLGSRTCAARWHDAELPVSEPHRRDGRPQRRRSDHRHAVSPSRDRTGYPQCN
jgi:hypothetical protein